MKMKRTVRQLMKESRNLESEAAKVAVSEFPVGSTVEYGHSDHTRVATVLRHNPYHPRLWVQGVTGSCYWLDAERVLEVLHAD